MDLTDRRIVHELSRDARLTWAELGKRVALSAPAVRERVRRLEEAGVVVGYQARVALAPAGYPLEAFVRIYASPERYGRVLKRLEESPVVLECHHLTGEESFLVRVALRSAADLEAFVSQFTGLGRTASAIVLSTPIRRGAPLDSDTV
jgi:Lrp/AsnC family leucine-responsive transcriptional regulator